MKPEDVRSLISEFVPEKVSADKWIRRIESLRTTFDWDERTILHYAVMRLGEVSQLWYEGVEDTIEGWADFKQRMVRAFPVRKDEVDVHNALSVRMKRSNESYENFVYDVVFQARAVNLSEAAIIKYVINGIPDCNLRLALCIANYTTVEKLLDAIYRYESQTKMRLVDEELRSSL